MTDAREDALAVLHRLSSFLRSLNAEELASLARGEVHLQLSSRPARRKRGTNAPGGDLNDLREQLGRAESRDAALALLGERARTRSSLQALSRSLDLPVQKTDSADRLRDRIVEATVGFRLRSEAIRGGGPSAPPS